MPENERSAIASELNQLREQILSLRHDYQLEIQALQAKASNVLGQIKLEATALQCRIKQEVKPLSRRLYLLESAHWHIVDHAEKVLEDAAKYE
jgi:hypothetical protein